VEATVEADRHRQETADRRARAWRRRLEGWSQQRIATELGVSQQMVSKMLRKLERQLAQQFTAEVSEARARQTAQLERTYMLLMEQWERSCEDTERVNTTTGRTAVFADGRAVELPALIATTRERQCGNPALIGQALAALQAIRRIWGLEAPTRHELAGPACGPIRIVEVDADGIRRDLDAKMNRLMEQYGLEAAAEESSGAE
jgi:predicted transcriptional regulator